MRHMRTLMLLLVVIAQPAQAQITPERTPFEWSQALVQSTMTRHPDVWAANNRLPWSYPIGFFIYAEHRVYGRTRDPAMLVFMRAWADSVVKPDGTLRLEERRLANLDAMEPAVALTMLYQATNDQRYRTAATQARRRYDDYPRTAGGGFWHRNPQTPGELWADGLFMAPILLSRYGQVMQDSAALNEAVRQFKAYLPHLRDARTGLLYHAWDEDGDAKWADSLTHHSPFFWGRAIGWTAMGMVEVLDALPRKHPDRSYLIKSIGALVEALTKFQDPATGLWWEIVDQGGQPGNWTEASASAMYTYAIARAVNEGYVNARYARVAQKGYRGALTKVSVAENGLVNVRDICEGTNVGSTYEWYATRKRNENDLHGLAAYLLMFEEMGRGKFAVKAQ